MGLKDKLKDTLCVAMFNRKGGSSKTINSLGLAWTFAQNDLRTLLIDADPQGSATNILGYNKNYENIPEISMKNISTISKKLKEERYAQDGEQPYIIDDLFGNPKDVELSSSQYTGLHDLITCVIDGDPLDKKTIEDAIVVPRYKVEMPKNAVEGLTLGDLANPEYHYEDFGFSLLPASEELTDDEMYMMSTEGVKGKPFILKKVIDAIKKHNLFDVIIIDCGPSLSFMSLNAVTAADGTVICCTLDQQSIFSICKAKKNFRDIKRYDENQAGILGVLLSIDDPRAVIRPIIIDRIKNTLNLYLFQNTIPRSANAPKSVTVGMTFPQIDGKARLSFSNVAHEIVERYNIVRSWQKHSNKIIEERKRQIYDSPELLAKFKKMANKDVDEYLGDRGRSRDDVDDDVISRIERLYLENHIMDNLRKEYDNEQLYEYMTNEYKGEE